MVEADYLVVGAGAMGMASTDTLIDHANVRVALVDRRHAPGGHWLEAYPFVRLHQASAFYGVASTLLGDGRLQDSGPERGLQERATQPEICAYFGRILTERLAKSGRVEFFGNCEYDGDRTISSRASGQRYEVPKSCRIVNAHYLAPDIPAETPPPFGLGQGVRVIPVNDLPRIQDAPSQYVIVGSGKTATDACIWLLSQGVSVDTICWVRPRDPWMLNRAFVQPDPAIFLGLAADTMEAAIAAHSLDDLFFRLEEAGVMLRIDRSVTPTMAKTPTLASWELDLLRTIEHVVRLGHLRQVEPGRLLFADGSHAIARDAVVVHCAAAGLKYPPRIAVWDPTSITLQPIRAGFPCFGAALIGYVEATHTADAEKNRVALPSEYGDSLAGWAAMNVLGARSTAAFGAAPDVKAWANTTTLNPIRIGPEHRGSPRVDHAVGRLQAAAPAGIESLSRLAG